MADHVREQIAVSALSALTGLTTTGAHVFRDRDTDDTPLQTDELPALTLDDDGDPAELLTVDAAGILERRMGLTVTAHVKAASGYSALLNQILKEIEVKLAATAITGAKLVMLNAVLKRDKSTAGDQPVVRQAFVFEILYYTAQSAPDVAL